SLFHPAHSTVKGRCSGERTSVFHVKFLKDDQSPGSDMPSQFANRINRIGIVHENKPAYDDIKLLLKLQSYWIAFEKFHIADPLLLSTGCRPCDSRSSPVCTDHLSTRPDEF